MEFELVQYQDSIPELAVAKTEYGARYLVPKSNTGIACYDVHNKFPWTLSNKNTRRLIPRIKLKEYRLKYSAELLSYINSARGFNENLGRFSLEDPVSRLALAAGAIGLGESSARSFFSSLGNATVIANVLKGIPGIGPRAQALLTVGSRAQILQGAKEVGKAAGAVAGFTGAASLAYYAYSEFSKPDQLLLNIDKNRSQKTSANDPYSNLYVGVASKIEYILPYISIDNMIGINASWQEPGKDSPITRLIEGSKQQLKRSGSGGEAAVGAVDFITTALEAAVLAGEPGAAREKIKGYTPPESGDSVEVSFYLFNTIDSKLTKMNWELLYVLTYQNLPNRRGINLLDPPCIYEVEIPGYKRFPVANIEKLKVSNEGTTRYVDLNTGNTVPVGTTGNVKLVPEAYRVTLTVRSLLTPTQNLFGWSDGQNTVQVFNAARSPGLNANLDLEGLLGITQNTEQAAAPAAPAAPTQTNPTPNWFNLGGTR